MANDPNTAGWRFQEFQFDSELDPRGCVRSKPDNASVAGPRTNFVICGRKKFWRGSN